VAVPGRGQATIKVLRPDNNPLIQQRPLARGLPRARKACQRCLAASFRSCS